MLLPRSHRSERSALSSETEKFPRLWARWHGDACSTRKRTQIRNLRCVRRRLLPRPAKSASPQDARHRAESRPFDLRPRSGHSARDIRCAVGQRSWVSVGPAAVVILNTREENWRPPGDLARHRRLHPLAQQILIKVSQRILVRIDLRGRRS